MNEGGTRKVIWFIGLFPVVVFLFVLPILETELGKKDRYRTNSVYGFRSTKAVKNAENWRKAQAIVRNSSWVFGGCQLLFILLSKRLLQWSDEWFLVGNTVVFFLLIGVQFFWVNSKLD